MASTLVIRRTIETSGYSGHVAPDGSDYGHDTVDSLLWRETRYLSRRDIGALPGSHAATLAAAALPANRSQESAMLPHDLFSAAGPGVSVGGNEPAAAQHASELSRSSFMVLWNLPGGSTETTRYLQTLWDFPQPFVGDELFHLARDGEVRVKINPSMPAAPDGTRIALVRKGLLIDDAGVTEDERDFITFSAQGIDPLESESWSGARHLNRVLEGCTPVITSVPNPRSRRS
jgi:hypothetical protein